MPELDRPDQPDRIPSSPDSPRRRLVTLLGAMAVPLAGSQVSCAQSSSANPIETTPPSEHDPSITLQGLSADPIPIIPKPAVRASGLSSPSYIDPVYGTRVYRATSARDYPGAAHVRHNYSRRQAWNANGSRYLAGTSNGYWLVYDGNTFTPLRRSGTDGALRGMAGDCEPIWHPTDPAKLWYMGQDALAWYEKDVERDVDTLLFNMKGRVPWAQATHIWTKGEGTPSADGRFFAFMATSYDEKKQENQIYGLLTYDRQQDQIVGTLDASRFGGAFPDHISMAPSGRFAVPSWAHNRQLGTRAYSPDFKSHVQLHSQSEHSDLAIGASGEDFYVVFDYDSGAVRAVDIATQRSFDILPLYPRSGASWAGHVSGCAYQRPGWVVISSYDDSANHGAQRPDPRLEVMHRKIMLIELKPNGRRFNVAHTRTSANYGGYYGEPQATISADATRIMFATNFDDGGPPDSWIIQMPAFRTA